MKIRITGFFKKVLMMFLVISLVPEMTSCGQKADKNVDFTPKLSSDTACQIKVAGSYSNFESLESEFERFNEHYPNVNLNYVYLDDYDNTIASALMSDEAPDIYVTASWMLDDDEMAPVLENAEILSDPSLEIDLECIRKGARWTQDNGDVIMRFFEGDVPMMLGSGDMVSGTQKRESKSEAFTEAPFKYKFYVVPLGDDGGYFLDSVNLFFSVNKNSSNLDMTNEFIRFLMREKELGNMAAIKRLITPANDFSLDEVYSSLEGFPEEKAFSYKETGVSDSVNKEFRAAAYKVANGDMTVDDAIILKNAGS